MRYKTMMLPALVLAVVIGVAAVRAGDSSEAVVAVGGDPLAKQTRSALSERGLTYELGGAPPASDAEKSTASVLREFDGFLREGSASVARVTFSDAAVGTVNKDGEVVDPKYVDREAIMVVLENQAVPMFGSMLSKGAAPETVTSTFVAFVDPGSFDVITAIAYAPGDLQVEASPTSRR